MAGPGGRLRAVGDDRSPPVTAPVLPSWSDGPTRDALVDFVEDKEGKPVAINRFIGRRPIAAFGNSDGDLQMLQWTTDAPGRRLGVIVHHTDAEREAAYGRESHIGRLDQALGEAPDRGWVVVDMKTDWKTIFPAGS